MEFFVINEAIEESMACVANVGIPVLVCAADYGVTLCSPHACAANAGVVDVCAGKACAADA